MIPPTNKFTYVIPYRHRQDRIMNLRKIIDWVSGFSGVEILIIEQDKHSRIKHLNLRATHVFVKSEMPFNKAWVYNIAIKRSSSDIIIFGNSDIIMNPMELIESIKNLGDNDVVIPCSTISRLTYQESSADFNTMLNSSKPQEKKICMSDGITIFKKSSIMNIGGWNEDFLKTGNFEDKFQDIKIQKFCKFKQLDYKSYHLWHNIDNLDYSIQERNQNLFNKYISVNDETLKNQSLSVIPMIGSLNKYS